MEKSENAPIKNINDKIDLLLLEHRRLFFSDAVDNDTARDTIRKLWYLEYTNPGKPILFIINSPGGSIDAGFAIWDQVKLITSPVTTLVTGLAASMGSILSLCAGKGKRLSTEHARIMIHQPAISGMVKGQATDLDIQAKEIIKTKKLLVDLYVKESGQSREIIEKKLDRDTWMSAHEAKAFGLIDHIISSYEEINF